MPKFSPKTYKAMANIMAKTYPRTTVAEQYLWEKIRDEMADLFQADNPAFKRDRFYAYCDPARAVWIIPESK